MNGGITGAPIDSAFVRNGFLFVDFFFVLSGFVIAANYTNRLDRGMPVASFALLRLGRIYPLHLMMLGAYLVVQVALWWAGRYEVPPRPLFDLAHPAFGLATNLLLLHAFGLHSTLTWNFPSWSIAVEFWSYLLFAAAVRLTGRHLDTVLAAVVVAAPVLLLSVGNMGIDVTYDWGQVRCLYGFALGAMLRHLITAAPNAAVGGNAVVWLGIETLAIAAIIAFVATAGSTRWNLLAPPVFGAGVVVFARERGAIARLLLAKPFLALGVLSYSIYMVHAFILASTHHAVGIVQHRLGGQLVTQSVTDGTPVDLLGATPGQGIMFVVVMLAIVIAVAAITQRLVERPGQHVSRRIAARIERRYQTNQILPNAPGE